MTEARQRCRPHSPVTARVPCAGVLTLALILAAPAALAQTVINPSANNGFATPDSAPAAKPNARTARAGPEASRTATATQSIVALVNDEPITGYEVEQRMRLSLLGAPEMQERLQKRLKSPNINEQFKAFALKELKANPPKSEAEQQARVQQLQGQFVESVKRDIEAEFRPLARKNALDDLIEERLKLQEAKRLNVVATNEDVDRIINGMAERNKMTAQQFADHMAKMGGNIAAMRAKISASLSWADVIRRRFGHQISVAGRDVERFVATAEGQDDVELRVHRILLATPADLGQAQVAQRLSDAERIRAQFSGCKSTDALARGVPGARFDDLGHRRPTSIPEPTRSLLLNAGDEEMLPPTIGEGGVELWAVCGRRVIKAEDVKRETAQNDLRQKEFEILSKKHLKDLRQDAHIEFR
jgi:peptidyl-prolyl cis-trans isomerase SurA